MSEPITIIALITGISGCIVAILHSIKYSECCNGLLKFHTRTNNNSPSTSTPPTISNPIQQEPRLHRTLPSPPPNKKLLIQSNEV
jgi:hypothetical protein